MRREFITSLNKPSERGHMYYMLDIRLRHVHILCVRGKPRWRRILKVQRGSVGERNERRRNTHT